MECLEEVEVGVVSLEALVGIEIFFLREGEAGLLSESWLTGDFSGAAFFLAWIWPMREFLRLVSSLVI